MSKWLCILLLVCSAAHAAPETAPSDDSLARFMNEKALMAQFEEMRANVAGRTSDLVVTAMGFLGVPYRRGGNSAETGFDCSGFVRAMYEQSVGLILPRQAIEQAEAKNRLIEVRTGELLARHEQISGDAAARTLPRPVRITAENVTPRVVSKNILGIATHETAEQVAERVTEGLGRYYAPLHEAAQRQQSAEIRAGQLAQQVEQLEAELKPLRPLLQGLDSDGVAAVLSHAEKVAERERVKTGFRAEFQRRVSAIVSPGRLSGPVATFMRIAKAALAKMTGDASQVDWGGVERDSIKQIIEDGWAPRRAGQVIQERSPGQVGRDPATMERELNAMPDTAEPKAKQPKQGQGFGPR
mgnify:CR=1 FL=1